MVHFKKIYIEVTNICNLSCSFCHHTHRPKSFMEVTEFAEIIRKISGHSQYIYLHVLGEAMLHPEFSQLMELSHKHGLQVNLTTNGTLLETKGDILLRSPALRQLNVSLHSFEHSPGPVLDRYLTGILNFIARLQVDTRKIWLNLRLWDLQETLNGQAAYRNQKIFLQLQKRFSLPANFFATLTSVRSLTLAPGIFLSYDRQFSWPHSESRNFGNKGTCRGSRDHIAILVDGTVVPCCLDVEADINLGNIHNQSLDEILASPKATQLRSAFTARQLIEPLCQHCNYRLRFS